MLIFLRNLFGYSLVMISTILVLVVIMLVVAPGLRYTVFRIVAELPTVATFFSLRGPVYHQDFPTAVAALERQMALSKYFKSKRSMNLPGLVENTEFLVNRLRLESEHKVVIPYLKRFVAKHPGIYDGQVWLAQSLLADDPVASLQHAKIAADLVSADDRAHRIAIEAELELGRFERAAIWCKRYLNAQFGGRHPYRYNNTFEGVGLRKIGLEIIDSRGQGAFALNSGLRLDQKTVYDFDLPKRTQFKKLVLHLGLLAGVAVSVDAVKFFGPDGTRTLAARDLLLSAKYGFFQSPTSLITVSPDGDVLTLRPLREPFPESDRIDVTLTVNRMNLTNQRVCRPVAKG